MPSSASTIEPSRPSRRAVRRLAAAEPAVTTAWIDGPAALGPIFVALRKGRLCALGFQGQAADLRGRLERRFGPGALLPAEGTPPEVAAVAAALGRWFEGDLRALDALDTDPGGTPFQQRVWAALRTIPPGETRSYAWLAEAIGEPAAARAVGAANGKNPISLAVPCHRVIGKGGALTGYAGGLERKRWLLDHEQTRRGRAVQGVPRTRG